MNEPEVIAEYGRCDRRPVEDALIVVESVAAVPADRLAVVCCQCGVVWAVDLARINEANVATVEHRTSLDVGIGCAGGNPRACLDAADEIAEHNQLVRW